MAASQNLEGRQSPSRWLVLSIEEGAAESSGDRSHFLLSRAEFNGAAPAPHPRGGGGESLTPQPFNCLCFTRISNRGPAWGKDTLPSAALPSESQNIPNNAAASCRGVANDKLPCEVIWIKSSTGSWPGPYMFLSLMLPLPHVQGPTVCQEPDKAHLTRHPQA